MKFLAVLLLTALTAHAEVFHTLGVNESLKSGDVISIVSVAPQTGGLWLQGLKIDDEDGVAKLVTGDLGPNSTTRWKVLEQTEGVFAFQCLGSGDGPMWLNGYTVSGEIALSLSPNGVSGASWAFYREGTGLNLKCLGSIAGKRWLVAGTRNQAALALDPDGNPSLWQIYVWKKDPVVAKPLR